MHKSQGFGRAGSRGKHVEHFKHLLGIASRRDLLDDVKLDRGSVNGGAKVARMLARAVAGNALLCLGLDACLPDADPEAA